MDKIVSVVHGNCDFDPIRFRAKIAIFDFDSIIVTSLKINIGRYVASSSDTCVALDRNILRCLLNGS